MRIAALFFAPLLLRVHGPKPVRGVLEPRDFQRRVQLLDSLRDPRRLVILGPFVRPRGGLDGGLASVHFFRELFRHFVVPAPTGAPQKDEHHQADETQKPLFTVFHGDLLETLPFELTEEFFHG